MTTTTTTDNTTQTQTQTPSDDTSPSLDIIIPPEAEGDNTDEEPELDYEGAYKKLPSHIKKACELFNYKPKAESQEQLEEMVTKLKADYEQELNTSVVPLIVAKIKGEKKIEKPGVQSQVTKERKRITSAYKGY